MHINSAGPGPSHTLGDQTDSPILPKGTPVMTKPLPRHEIDAHLGRLGLSRATGRAGTAPQADAGVDTTLADRGARQQSGR